ncbi:hypothetical protein CU254_41440 (plasmid) [Amycolatopsis sp. AA4]|nr:hypothetical protein CU254_41440 [Amycolatopsis sp. AA4]EFL12452.1 predicted protein [Streptomyces sp. AA4]
MDDPTNATLHAAVAAQLDRFEILLGKADDRSRAAASETMLAQLVDACRALLAAHAPDERGRCRECSTPWLFVFRRSRCTVWRTAGRHLISESPDRAGTGRHRARGLPVTVRPDRRLVPHPSHRQLT